MRQGGLVSLFKEAIAGLKGKGSQARVYQSQLLAHACKETELAPAQDQAMSLLMIRASSRSDSSVAKAALEHAVQRSLFEVVGHHKSARFQGVPEACALLHANLAEAWRTLANPQRHIHEHLPDIHQSSGEGPPHSPEIRVAFRTCPTKACPSLVGRIVEISDSNLMQTVVMPKIQKIPCIQKTVV